MKTNSWRRIFCRMALLLSLLAFILSGCFDAGALSRDIQSGNQAAVSKAIKDTLGIIAYNKQQNITQEQIEAMGVMLANCKVPACKEALVNFLAQDISNDHFTQYKVDLLNAALYHFNESDVSDEMIDAVFNPTYRYDFCRLFNNVPGKPAVPALPDDYDHPFVFPYGFEPSIIDTGNKNCPQYLSYIASGADHPLGRIAVVQEIPESNNMPEKVEYSFVAMLMPGEHRVSIQNPMDADTLMILSEKPRSTRFILEKTETYEKYYTINGSEYCADLYDIRSHAVLASFAGIPPEKVLDILSSGDFKLKSGPMYTPHTIEAFKTTTVDGKPVDQSILTEHKINIFFNWQMFDKWSDYPLCTVMAEVCKKYADQIEIIGIAPVFGARTMTDISKDAFNILVSDEKKRFSDYGVSCVSIFEFPELKEFYAKKESWVAIVDSSGVILGAGGLSLANGIDYWLNNVKYLKIP